MLANGKKAETIRTCNALANQAAVKVYREVFPCPVNIDRQIGEVKLFSVTPARGWILREGKTRRKGPRRSRSVDLVLNYGIGGCRGCASQ